MYLKKLSQDKNYSQLPVSREAIVAGVKALWATGYPAKWRPELEVVPVVYRAMRAIEDGESSPELPRYHGWKGKEPANMIRIDIAYLYRLGVTFTNVQNIKTPITMGDAIGPLYELKQSLDGMLTPERIYPFKTAKKELLACQKDLEKTLSDLNFERELNPLELYTIQKHLREVISRVTGEMEIADAYFVTPKSAFDMSTLLFDATKLFPAALIASVPLAIPDVLEAGKCIAFELPTAAGFHIHRANEAVMRAYFDIVTNNAPHPNTRNIEAYLKELEKLGKGDAKVIAALRDLKDLHRNPLIHPEQHLTMDQLIGVLGAVQGTITVMLDEINKK